LVEVLLNEVGELILVVGVVGFREFVK